MNKPPAFQFYADDFIGGVNDMTQAEVGAYIMLLCHQWNRGSIPVEPERQQMIAKGPVSTHVIAKFKACPDGQLRNERLESERQKQADYREKQRLKGIASGQARAKSREPLFNRGSTVVKPSHEPETNSPSPSSFDKAYSTKAKQLSGSQKELADRIEAALGNQWVNDAGKWINRIKSDHKKTSRVIAELESAIKGKTITTTPAQYAEDTWGRFK